MLRSFRLFAMIGDDGGVHDVSLSYCWESLSNRDCNRDCDDEGDYGGVWDSERRLFRSGGRGSSICRVFWGGKRNTLVRGERIVPGQPNVPAETGGMFSMLGGGQPLVSRGQMNRLEALRGDVGNWQERGLRRTRCWEKKIRAR